MNVRRSFPTLLAICLSKCTLITSLARAQPSQAVPVVHVQGTSHAFLVLRAESGKVLGYGELLQIAHGTG